MKTYVIGRSRFADIVLPDTSVAPRHAELVVTDGGRLHLTDCASGNGTWRLTGRAGGASHARQLGWERIRQTFVTVDQALRLGEHECTAGELLRSMLSADGPGEGGSGGGNWRPGAAMRAGPERVRGPVERDPVTGEIIRKRL